MGVEQWKIDNHTNDTPGTPFPEFVSLSEAECAGIRERIAQVIKIAPGGDAAGLFAAFHERSAAPVGVVPCVNDPTQGKWSFRELLNKHGYEHAGPLYINWHHFDDIDVFRSGESVERCFGSIWYPGPDDIDLFDDSLAWVLSVNHDGYIELRKLSR